METKRWMKRFVIFKFIQEFTLVFFTDYFFLENVIIINIRCFISQMELLFYCEF